MSSLYQKRGIYYYQGKDEDGNRVQQSLRTRDRAEAQECSGSSSRCFIAGESITCRELGVGCGGIVVWVWQPARINKNRVDAIIILRIVICPYPPTILKITKNTDAATQYTANG